MHGKDLHSGRKLKNWMVETGYVDVVEQQFFVPLNQWPLDPVDKELGSWCRLNWLKFLGGTKKLLAAGGVPLEEKYPYCWKRFAMIFRIGTCACIGSVS